MVMVLVQWLGLSPEETSWEAWKTVCDKFRLKDKVNFSAGGIDSNQNPSILNTTNATEAQDSRPKRSATRLAYLKDYV